MFTLKSFYRSKEWEKFRECVIAERIQRDGEVICSYCKKAILEKYDLIAHHCNTYLNESNVNDYNISLNPDNIQLVHMACHNKIHYEKGFQKKKVIVVFGSPCSGKSTFVNEAAWENDLIIDVNRLYESINNYRSNKLLSTVMDLQRYMLETIRTRKGQWQTAYIITTSPFNAKRIKEQVDADDVLHINTPKDICYERAANKSNEYKEFLDKYWDEVESNPLLLEELQR